MLAPLVEDRPRIIAVSLGRNLNTADLFRAGAGTSRRAYRTTRAAGRLSRPFSEGPRGSNGDFLHSSLGPEHKDTADLFRAQCEARAAGRPIPTATRAAGAAAPTDISERASRVATSDYSTLSITELKQRLDDLGVPRWDCCEKSALVAKLQQNASNV